MSEFITEFFVATTGEDQANCFSDDLFTIPSNHIAGGATLPRGLYRVIDGNLCRVVSGLPLDEIRTRLKAGV